MTDEEFRRRLTALEREANAWSFGCDRSCTRDFWEHAEPILAHLAECLEAEFYGRSLPPINNPDPHVAALIAHHQQARYPVAG